MAELKWQAWFERQHLAVCSRVLLAHPEEMVEWAQVWGDDDYRCWDSRSRRFNLTPRNRR